MMLGQRRVRIKRHNAKDDDHAGKREGAPSSTAQDPIGSAKLHHQERW
jgi:hypothetical protein